MVHGFSNDHAARQKLEARIERLGRSPAQTLQSALLDPGQLHTKRFERTMAGARPSRLIRALSFARAA